ncbi:MAG TPA: tetratricopeptide repeat protein, partial [Isosphaeraceae bacterium]|nr:tetratricopeptide repeat protein [Isosphaeraceae bacterium]
MSCYDRLARLLRTDLRRNQDADATIKKMVANNPKAGRAYLYRWRYTREFLASADANDIQKALALAPDDPEVLWTAAIASEQKPDAAAERAYLEKGYKLDPKNAAFAIGLARLELREQHPDRAEAVLRQTFEARPSVDLAFLLAENLIIQGKIEGKDQAGGYIAYLRARGLGDTSVRYLEARIPFQQQKWAEAIPKLEMARALLKSDSGMTSQLNLMLADCYKRLGSGEQRLDALRQAAESEQGSGSARLELARALARSGKLDEALAILLPLAERQPESRLDIVRLSIQKTLRLPQDKRRWQEVEQRLHEAEKALPNAVEDLTALEADLLSFQGKPEAAKGILDQAIQRNPKSVRSRIALAGLLLRRNDVAHAEKVLDQAEKDLGTSPDLLRARVGFWSRRGGDEAKKAINQLAESRHQIPAVDQPVFLDELATAFYRLDEPVRAGQLWQELSKLQPENLEILSRRADLAIAASDRPTVDEVVGLIKRIEGDQGTIWRYAEAAFLLGEVGRRDATTSEAARKSASNLVEEILTRRGNWSGGFVLRGQLAELAGKPEDAVRDYLRAIDLGATQPELARRLVGLLYQLKQIDQIDQVVQKLNERGMALDELKLASAINALRRQDFDGAIAMAREVIPESSSNYFDLLILSRILLAAGRTAEAEKPLKRALELAPGVSDVWVDEVRFLVDAGRTREIPQVLEQAGRVLPRDQVTKTLALCQSIAGNDEAAAKLFKSALDLNPDDPVTLRLAAEHYVKVLKLETAEPLIA